MFGGGHTHSFAVSAHNSIPAVSLTFFLSRVKTKPLCLWNALLNVESEEDVFLVPKNELQEMQKTNAAKA